MAKRTKATKRGTGSIFRQAGRLTWMMQFYENGARKIQTTGTTDEAEARRLLNERLGLLASGEATITELTGARDAYTFDAAAAAYLTDMKAEGRTSADGMRGMIALHLTPAFGGRRLDTITATEIKAYVVARMEPRTDPETGTERPGAARATVNIELAVLRRIFRLAMQDGLIRRHAPITIPDPKNAREGFFEAAQFEAVRAKLPEWLQGPATLAYFSGWRLASEILTLEWRHVDRGVGAITIYRSKNGKGRTLMYGAIPELVAAIEAAHAVHEARAKAGTITPLVFHRDGAPLTKRPHRSRRTGQAAPFVRQAWAVAVRAAGVPGRKPHDFRRTAVRNLVRAGVPDVIAMQITGHKTRHVFDRYHIVNERDLAAAMRQYGAAMGAAPAAPAAAPASA
jgi:integrase